MNEEINFEEVAPWLVAGVTLLGGGLRILLLGSKGMWLDETFSVWMASHNVGELLRWTATVDQHPPLYYLLLHVWIALRGDSPYAVRLLSVLLGTATIPVIYGIGKRLSDPLMGFAAAVLLAVSPFHIRFAQETRMYTCLAFNAAVAIYALVRLLTDPRSAEPIGSQFRAALRAWRTTEPVKAGDGEILDEDAATGRPTTGEARRSRHRWPPRQTFETDLAWVGFVVFSAATMLTHNTAVLFPLATHGFVLGLMLFQRLRKTNSPAGLHAPSLQNWLKAQAGIFLLWSPWLGAFIHQARGVYQEFWLPRPDWQTVTRALMTFLNAATPAPGQSSVEPAAWMWLLYATVAGLGLWRYRKEPSRWLLLVALFAIPFAGELLVSLRRPVFYDRTLIWITIPLFLLLAAGITQLRYRFLVILALGILGANNLFAAADYYRFMQKEDWNTAAGYVANFVEQDDLVLFNANWAQIPFDYYFRAYEDLYDIRVEKRGLPEDMFESGVLEPKMTENDVARLMSLVNGRERVWLVYSHDWYTDPQGLIPKALGARMHVARQRYFYGGQVLLYAAP